MKKENEYSTAVQYQLILLRACVKNRRAQWLQYCKQFGADKTT